MIAMQLMSADLSRAPSHSTAAIERERARCGSPPADEPAKVIAQFQPLDPGIVSDAIPAFFIGRNKEGFWVARDGNGQIGGIFLLRSSALSFVKSTSWREGIAIIYPSERIELDLDNKGNPLVVLLVALMQLAMRLWQRIVTMTEAMKRGLNDLHGL